MRRPPGAYSARWVTTRIPPSGAWTTTTRRHLRRENRLARGGADNSGSSEAPDETKPLKQLGSTARARRPFEPRRKEHLMETSSKAYASLDPTELDNFKNPLRLPGEGGAMGVLE